MKGERSCGQVTTTTSNQKDDGVGRKKTASVSSPAERRPTAGGPAHQHWIWVDDVRAVCTENLQELHVLKYVKYVKQVFPVQVENNQTSLDFNCKKKSVKLTRAAQVFHVICENSCFILQIPHAWGKVWR